MKRARTTLFDATYMATMAVLGLLALSCLVAVSFSSEQQIPTSAEVLGVAPERDVLIEAPVSIGIVGPDSVPAGTGRLIRLEADVPAGDSVTWLPLAPIFGLDPAFHFLENDGLTWGCATPSESISIKVQLIDWTAQTWEFHEVVVGDGPSPPPPPPPVDKLVVLIIEESRDRGPTWGDIWNVLQRDTDMARHSLAIIDDDQSGALGVYAAMTAERPAIILDVDYDPAEVLYVGVCPDSVSQIKSLVSRYVRPGDISSLGPNEDGLPSDADAGGPRVEATTAPVPRRIKSEQPRYVWITDADGKRYGRDNETGALYPVDESRLTFCVGDRCFRVPAK